MLAIIAAIAALRTAPAPDRPAAPRLQLASITLTGAGAPVSAGAGPGAASGQLDFSKASQSGLLTLF